MQTHLAVVLVAAAAFIHPGKEYTCPACRRPKTRLVRDTSALSFRERQIIALIAEAKANKEIAYHLCLTEGTVKEYLYHIFRKLNVTSRTELALWSRGSSMDQSAA
jgi:DNA-binding NarL/FixJ family response regulator